MTSLKENDFNLDLQLSLNDNYLTKQITSMMAKDYIIKNNDVIGDEDVDILIEKAKDLTLAINDISNPDYEKNVDKYMVRMPSLRVDENREENMSYLQWQESDEAKDKFLSDYKRNGYQFKEIKDYELSYDTKSEKTIRIHVSGLQSRNDKKTHEAIFEYDFIYEEASQSWKVENFTLDIEDVVVSAQNQMVTRERQQNSRNGSPLTNVSKYIPNGLTTLNYASLKNVTALDSKTVIEKNESDVIIINGVTESGIKIGNTSGFFVRSGIISTSWQEFSKMLYEKTKFYVTDVNDNNFKITGIVAVYPQWDVVLLKSADEGGIAPSFADFGSVQRGDAVSTVSSSLGLKMSLKWGVITNEKISLPLLSGDSGSPIFNKSGDVVAIVRNTRDDSATNRLQPIDVLRPVIDKLQKTSFEKIKVIPFSELMMKVTPKVDQVNSGIWKKYQQLPIITNYFPLSLYSSYVNDKYLVLRYYQENDLLDNSFIIDTYKKYLMNNLYVPISNDTYQKDDVIIRIEENLDFVIIVVEGVV